MYCTRVGSSLIFKLYTKLERLARGQTLHLIRPIRNLREKSFITLSPEEDYRYTAHRDDSYDIANITTYNKNHCNYDLVRRKSYRLMAGAKCSR